MAPSNLFEHQNLGHFNWPAQVWIESKTLYNLNRNPFPREKEPNSLFWWAIPTKPSHRRRGSLTKLKANGKIGSFGSLANRKQCWVMKSQLSCLSIDPTLDSLTKKSCRREASCGTSGLRPQLHLPLWFSLYHGVENRRAFIVVRDPCFSFIKQSLWIFVFLLSNRGCLVKSVLLILSSFFLPFGSFVF